MILARRFMNDDAETHAALDHVCKAEQALLNAYPEINPLLITYQSAPIDLFSLNSYQDFVIGFRMGAQIMQEMLTPFE